MLTILGAVGVTDICKRKFEARDIGLREANYQVYPERNPDSVSCPREAEREVSDAPLDERGIEVRSPEREGEERECKQAGCNHTD